MTMTTRGSGEGKPVNRRTRSTDENAEGKAKRSPPGSPLRSSPSPKVTHKSPHSKRTYFHVHPTHTIVRSSPLSKDSGNQNYRGFFNLAVLLLAVSNIRLAIENYLKYGLLVSFSIAGVRETDVFWSLMGYVQVGIHILIAYLTERRAVAFMTANVPSHPSIKFLHVMNLTSLLVGSMANSWFNIWHPFLSAAPLTIALIAFLKLISYVLVNGDLRGLHVSGRKWEKSKYMDDDTFDPTSLPYPKNITLGNLLYFIFAPTLNVKSYQPIYPRNEGIRVLFIVKRTLEFLSALFGMYFLGAQYAGPILQNSLEIIEKGDLLRLTERLLKLSVISVLLWLLMFFAFFHCYMNIAAELLRFGDRRFYQPWWNAKDISEYWRLWNNPVYSWGKRHVYLALNINQNTPRWLSVLVVFTISAILHEVLIGIPTHCLNGIAFMGMMGQIPLIVMTFGLMHVKDTMFPDYKEFFDTIGNLIFWISFTIVGQPACILIYYYQWYIKNAALAKAETGL